MYIRILNYILPYMKILPLHPKLKNIVILGVFKQVNNYTLSER